jgi:hypothetical protein
MTEQDLLTAFECGVLSLDEFVKIRLYLPEINSLVSNK